MGVLGVFGSDCDHRRGHNEIMGAGSLFLAGLVVSANGETVITDTFLSFFVFFAPLLLFFGLLP